MNRFATSSSSRPRAFTALVAGVLATAAFLGAPTMAAAAQPAADAPRTIVHYSFSDLSTDQNTRALYQRIVTAARAVCPEYDPRDLTAFAASQQCQRQAVAAAIHQIGNSRLAAVHARAVARHG